MTKEFIEKNCKTCEKCIFERDTTHRFYPYPSPSEYLPTYCGEITDEGCKSVSLKELKTCIKTVEERGLAPETSEGILL